MDNYIIAWTDALLVGEPTVDAQHRRSPRTASPLPPGASMG
jgi:hypothetical protein